LSFAAGLRGLLGLPKGNPFLELAGELGCAALPGEGPPPAAGPPKAAPSLYARAPLRYPAAGYPRAIVLTPFATFPFFR
jgi:hypothetical protein